MKKTDIAFLRCIAVLSLVLWHAYGPYTCWHIVCTPFNHIYSGVLTRAIPDADMPLFTSLAGMLFYYLYDRKGKYREFFPFLRKKIRRLLIPFIILGSFTALTEYGKNIADMLYGIPSHLWYCLMLFYVYIVFRLVENKLHPFLNIVLAVLSMLFVVCAKSGALAYKCPGGLLLPCYYYCYFAFGYYMYRYAAVVKAKSFCCFAAGLTAYMLSITLIPNVFLLSASYILLLLSSFYLFRIEHLLETHPVALNVVNTLSFLSFGVYVFHQWIIWNITREPYLLSLCKPIMKEHYVLFPFVLYAFVLVISFALTRMLMKTKVGTYLLTCW